MFIVEEFCYLQTHIYIFPLYNIIIEREYTLAFLKKERKRDNAITYDYKSGQYLLQGNLYSSYQEAKLNQWKCNKCQNTFGSLKQLRLHKIESHSY